jgi:predicted nuclease of predicted toxin-antitoxin system
MKLLLDANLSYRLKKPLGNYFEVVEHVDAIFEERPTDYQIWEYAFANNFIIATNDEDYENILNMRGFPPKVILFRTGNQSNAFLLQLIEIKMDELNRFVESEVYGIMEIYTVE